MFVLGDQLKVVSTMSVGYDHLDVITLKLKGIKVDNLFFCCCCKCTRTEGNLQNITEVIS